MSSGPPVIDRFQEETVTLSSGLTLGGFRERPWQIHVFSPSLQFLVKVGGRIT